MDGILLQMLARGDHVAIEHGRLVIQPASGKPVPESWLAEKSDNLIKAVLELAGMDALKYLSYSTGQYDGGRGAGLTLQMVAVLTGEPRYTIFNVGLKRMRNNKSGAAGTPLPKGQFLPPKGGSFAKLWEATCLPCRALSGVWQSMGRLQEILFAGRLADGERVQASTLQPLSISASMLRAKMPGTASAIMVSDSTKSTVKPPLSNRYASVKEPLRAAVKETQQAQQPQGLQPESTTGHFCHGNKVIRKHGYKGTPTPPHTDIGELADVWTPEELENAYRLGWCESIHGIADKSRKS